MSQEVTYSIRRSQRAKKMRIIVSMNKVEIVAPLKTPEKKIYQFVESNEQWIISALEKIATRPVKLNNLQPVLYTDGIDIYYQGQVYKLSIKTSTLKRVKIEFNDCIIAYIPETQSTLDCSESIKNALVIWMKKQIKLHVLQWVNHHATKKNLYPRSINIKTQKSRWGSCGINNDIQINWLLMMAPPEVLEYVVVHELCHIQERNHSQNFWSLVALHLPDYKHRQQWLKQHGSQLMQGL